MSDNKSCASTSVNWGRGIYRNTPKNTEFISLFENITLHI